MDNERAESVQIQKHQLLEQRKVIQSQMRAQKDELMSQFEKIQKTGVIPDELMDKLGQDRVNSLNNTRKNESIISHERSPDKRSKPQPSNVTASRTNKPEKSVDRAVKDHSISNNLTQQKNEMLKTNDKYSKSKLAKDENKRKITELDEVKNIEELKMQQNAELLELLNTEQKIEEEREKMLNNIKENEEKKRLEKIFGIERAKASARIIKLSEQHEKALFNMQKNK